ncbi:hypothetical protein SARC_01331, partial [Sphaeroforma arctica JP610]
MAQNYKDGKAEEGDKYSQWVSSVRIVQKDSKVTPTCVDHYRMTNNSVPINRGLYRFPYQLPIEADMVEHSRNAIVQSAADLAASYHQLLLHPDELRADAMTCSTIWITTFRLIEAFKAYLNDGNLATFQKTAQNILEALVDHWNNNFPIVRNCIAKDIQLQP